MPFAPDSVELAEVASTWRSAYVHIPFCASICPYCDFAVVAGRDDDSERYLAALETEIRSDSPWGPLDAIFVGGGTPTRTRPSRLGKVIETLGVVHGKAPVCEISIEANPEDVDRAAAEGLTQAGVNRISFGAQSFDAAVLTDLGRNHEPATIATAVAAAKDGGVSSVNLDLIFGSPVESIASWERTVNAAIALNVEHVSVYALTVEPATPLGMSVRRGGPAPDPDDQADKWELAAERLEAAGYARYEVSNFSRPGHACRYNLAVWGHAEYLAFGLGAHGFRDGVRRRNVRRLDTYIERVESGLGPVQTTDRIEGWAAELERLMVGLRRACGVRLGSGGTRLLGSAEGRRLVEAGVIAQRDGWLVVERPLLTDAVVRTVLGLTP